MKAISMRFFKLSLICLLLASSAFARDLQDMTGAKVHLADSPARIVTLAPSLGELAADLVEQDLGRIVGVSEYTDFPPALEKVKSVGPYAHLNLEMIAALKPDLVLATADGNSKEQVLHLREIGIPVVVVDTSSFKGIEDSILLVARAMGLEARGQAMLAGIRKGLARIDERAQARRASGRPRVLLQLGDKPLVVAGGASFLNEALERVGAVNVYKDSSARYPRPSLEDAVARNPDVILVARMGSDSAAQAALRSAIQSWSAFNQLKAVKENRVLAIPTDTLLRPTPRILEGLAFLERAIFGGRK